MPPPRKIDLLPAAFREQLQAELRESGFGDYVGITERLNFRLEEAGLTLRVGKSAVHEFGAEYREFVRLQEQASDWAAEWLGEMDSLRRGADEIERIADELMRSICPNPSRTS